VAPAPSPARRRAEPRSLRGACHLQLRSAVDVERRNRCDAGDRHPKRDLLAALFQARDEAAEVERIARDTRPQPLRFAAAGRENAGTGCNLAQAEASLFGRAASSSARSAFGETGGAGWKARAT